MGTGGAGGGSICGDAPSPIDTNCPPACDKCRNGTCVFECKDNECQFVTLACPADRPCEVDCKGANSCYQAVIDCPATYACDVVCDDDNACFGATQNCDSGTCTLECAGGVNACFSSTLNCGSGECNAVCNTNADPTVNCGNACMCNQSGC